MKWFWSAPHEIPFALRTGCRSLPILPSRRRRAASIFCSWQAVLLCRKPNLSLAMRTLARMRAVAREHLRLNLYGASALGHAELLDGKRVTTHWQIAQKLADRFPRPRLSMIASTCATAALPLPLRV